MTTASPLVVVCFDAGDPALIETWSEQGHLPTLRSIQERGWWSRTRGPELNVEHGVWLSLLSGTSRGRHGYHYFRQLTPGAYDLELVDGPDVATRPFWADVPGRVAVIDAPDAALRTDLDGIQLLDWAVHDPKRPPSARPASLLDEAPRIFGPYEPIRERIRSSFDDDAAIHLRLLERVERKTALCRYLLRDGTCRTIVIGFAEPHTGGHQLWRYREGNQTEVPPGPLTHGIRDIYAAVDRGLGRILDDIGEANVVVVTSVGLKDQFPMDGMGRSFLRELGYQQPAAPDQRSLRPLDIARRLLPRRVRIALSKNLSRERREALVADAFRNSTDWSRTSAFVVPSAYTTYIRVNLAGREPRGIVPADGYDEVLDRIEADLALVVDPETGAAAVDRVERTRAVFGPDAATGLPDLFVHWRPAARFIERLTHPRAELTQEEPEFFRDSDHTAEGFLAVAGPAVTAAGHCAAMDPLDVARMCHALAHGRPV